MIPIKHKIQHYYQPTNTSCGYAALAMLLSFYDKEVGVEDLLASVEQPTDDKGEPTGSITTELVSWCLTQGFNSVLYSFDCLMLDLSWQKLTQSQLLEKIEATQGSRDVLGLGVEYGRRYLKAYADMLKAGGRLNLQPHVTTTLLNDLLTESPVYANVCSDVMDNLGRTKTVGLREFVEDDVNGRLHTHSIVIYGIDERGEYLVADPWRGLRTLNADTLICSITMAQIECDNMVFQLTVAK
jgi:hypothetical protein